MAFTAIISADTLEAALDPVSALVDECKIRLTEDGLEIRAVDPANVAMVDLSLEAAAFESYEADDGVIGVDLGRLEDVVGMASSGDLVHFELDAETGKLEVSIDALEYTLGLIDPDSIRQEPDIPDLDLPARVALEGSDLSRIVKAADLASDHVDLGVDEGDEVFYADAAGDTDDVRVEFDHDHVIRYGPAHSKFSLDYLKDMAKAIPGGAEIEAELGEEFPTKLHYDIADGEGQVTFMLAPRIAS